MQPYSMGKTLYAEATVEIARPLHQRITSRLFGRPPSPTYMTTLVAEALVDAQGEPMLSIEVKDGRAHLVITGDPDSTKGGAFIHVRRLSLRERGTNGKFHKTPRLVVIDPVTMQEALEKATRIVAATDLDIIGDALARAGGPHTGGVIEGARPYLAGERGSETVVPTDSPLLARITSIESVRIPEGMPTLAHCPASGRVTVRCDGAKTYDPRQDPAAGEADIPGDMLRLAALEAEELADAARLERAAVQTNVAKRKGAYAVRAREHRERAATIANARAILARFTVETETEAQRARRRGSNLL